METKKHDYGALLGRGKGIYNLIQENRDAYARSTKGRVPTVVKLHPDDFKALKLFCEPTVGSYANKPKEPRTIFGMRIDTDDGLQVGYIAVTEERTNTEPIFDSLLRGERRLGILYGLLAGLFIGSAISILLTLIIL